LSAFLLGVDPVDARIDFSMARVQSDGGCCAITRAIIAGVNSGARAAASRHVGRTHSPFSSNLPTTRGRTSSRQL
jgi:hypothetical protein